MPHIVHQMSMHLARIRLNSRALLEYLCILEGRLDPSTYLLGKLHTQSEVALKLKALDTKEYSMNETLTKLTFTDTISAWTSFRLDILTRDTIGPFSALCRPRFGILARAAGWATPDRALDTLTKQRRKVTGLGYCYSTPTVINSFFETWSSRRDHGNRQQQNG